VDATDTSGETPIYLDADAAALLAQLAPEPVRRGPFVGELIRAAAQAHGLLAAPGDGASAASRPAPAPTKRRTRGGSRAPRTADRRPPLSEGEQLLADDQRHAGSGG
jgi:hypothetical protein